MTSSSSAVDGRDGSSAAAAMILQPGLLEDVGARGCARTNAA